MTHDFANEVRPPSKSNWLLTIVLVSVAGLGFGWFMRELSRPLGSSRAEAEKHPAVGMRAPELTVEGWFHGNALTAADLAGKIYVIDAWEFWCGPCLEYAPHSVELYEKYKDKGVVFLGLTSGSGEKELQKSETFLQRAKFPWPNAYGGAEMLMKLYNSDNMTVPQMWVIDQQGIIAWAGHPMELETELLDRLVAAAAPSKLQTAAESPAKAVQTPSPGG